MAIFKRNHLFQTIILGIQVSFRECVLKISKTSIFTLLQVAQQDPALEFFRHFGREKNLLLQDGPLAVISRVITSLIGVITPVTTL